MIFYYFPIVQNTINKTVSDFFQRCKCLYMYVHIFYYFSIYWSDTSLYARLCLTFSVFLSYVSLVYMKYVLEGRMVD